MPNALAESFDFATEFVSLHYPDCEAALLCGSAVEGNYSMHSDLDIVILVAEESPMSFNSEIFQQKKLDLMQVSVRNILDFILSDIHTRSAIGSRMLLSGRIITDKNNTLSRILPFARYYFFRGPSRLSMRNISPILFSIKNGLSALRTDRSFGEEAFILQLLTTELMTLLLDEYGCWEGLSKWRVKYLRSFSPARCEEFEQAISQYWKKKDSSEIEKFTANALRRWQEPEKYISLDANPSVFFNNQCTTAFQIPSRRHYEAWINEFFLPLKKELGLPDNRYFFFFKNDRKWPSLEVIFVVYGECYTALNQLTDQIAIRWASLGWKNSVDEKPLKYRYITGPFGAARFGGIDFAEAAEKLFSSISPMIISYGVDEEKAIGKSLYVLIAFGKGMGFSRKVFKSFLLFSFEYTVVLEATFDTSHVPPPDFMNSVLSKFNMKFQIDEAIVKPVFQPLSDAWDSLEFMDPGLEKITEEVKILRTTLLSLEKKGLLKSYMPRYTGNLTDQYTLQVMEIVLNMLGLSHAEIPYVFYICGRLF